MDRYGGRFSLVIIDVIGKVGHSVTDDVVRKVAGLLKQEMRSSDFATKYERCRFALVLIETDYSLGLDVAKNQASD